MNPRQLLGIAAVLALSATACGRTSTPEQQIRRLLEDAATQSFEYTYSESSGGRRMEVHGEVEDSFRRIETLRINGRDALQRVTNDDAMSIRVLSPEGLPTPPSVDPADAAVLSTLQAGRWVTDPAGAPKTQVGDKPEVTGADPLSDAAGIFRYVQLAVQSAAGVFEFNPDSPEYREQEDPFPHPEKSDERPSENPDERRFDLVAPALPRREGGQFPTTSNFRKLAIYVRKGGIVRILEVIDVRGHRDFIRARQTGRNPFLLQLQKDVEAGRGPEKVRPRKMAFEIQKPERSVTVGLPQDALIGNLQVLFATRPSDTAVSPATAGGGT